MSTSSVLGAVTEGAASGSWRKEGPSLQTDGFTGRWACAANLERKTGRRRDNLGSVCKQATDETRFKV